MVRITLTAILACKSSVPALVHFFHRQAQKGCDLANKQSPQLPSLPWPWPPTTPAPRTSATATPSSSPPAAASRTQTAARPAVLRSVPADWASAAPKRPPLRTARRAAVSSTPTLPKPLLPLRHRSRSRGSKLVAGKHMLKRKTMSGYSVS